MENGNRTPDTRHRTPSRLSRLIFVADGFTRSRVADVVLDLGRGGVLPWVHLRDHDCDEGGFRLAARSLVDALRAESPETMISFNGHADLARELGVGLHIGFRGPGPRRARELVGPGSVFGYSVHAKADLPKSVIAIIDYSIIGPIYDSISKPNLTATSTELLANIVDISSKPVFAIGGIRPQNVGECLQAGAYGVAVVGGILEADEPVSSAEAYLRAVSKTETIDLTL